MPWSNQSGGGWQGGGGNRGPWGQRGSGGGGPTPPDLEEILKRSQERLRRIMPGGSIGGTGLVMVLLALVFLWGISGFYRVLPDEQGVVLRFGEFVTTTQPGLNYHLPYPIESALTPKVTRVNRIDIGMRTGDNGDSRRDNAARDVPEESLILTGDENIVDVDFSVFWVIKDAGDYLFNIQNPAGTVKAVAESAMREIVGTSDIQPLLTQARQRTEVAVHELMQRTLDDYQSGIRIAQVQLQKVDPPAQVIDAFRDVQAARADQERLRNEAETYANKVIPEARGDAERILQAAEAYKQQTIAEAQGQAARFLSVLQEYQLAPDVTRERIFLETIEQVFSGKSKIIIDEQASGTQGVVPYLPLNELNRRTGNGGQ